MTELASVALLSVALLSASKAIVDSLFRSRPSLAESEKYKIVLSSGKSLSVDRPTSKQQAQDVITLLDRTSEKDRTRADHEAR